MNSRGTYPTSKPEPPLSSPTFMNDLPQTFMEPWLFKAAGSRGNQARMSTEYLSPVQGAEAVTTTPIEPPAHLVQGRPFINEVPLPQFFGSGLVVAILQKKWEPITGDDLEAAWGHTIRPGDGLILNTGWHKRCEGRGA